MDRKYESFSERVEAVPIASARNLNSEFLSVMVELEPSVAARVTVRPLTTRPARLSESLSDRKNELWSARLEDDPIESVSVLRNSLFSEPVRDSESVKDLNIEFFVA
jgi:hypothetical protein